MATKLKVTGKRLYQNLGFFQTLVNNEVVAKWKTEGFLESLFLRQTRNGEIWC